MQNNPQIVTCAEMKEIERRAAEGGLSYYQMMENAGVGAAEFIISRIPVEGKQIFVFCGKGNNGGDGFVVARILHEHGAVVKLILVEGEPKTQDAIANSELCQALRIPRIPIEELPDKELFKEPAIIVDAIYGTGFHGSLRDEVRKATAWINYVRRSADSANHGDVSVFALDIPSGANGDTGTFDPHAVRADYTLAFHRFKPIHIMEEAKDLLGETVCLDIGIPSVC